MTKSATRPAVPTRARGAEALSIVAETRELFEEYFDRTWLTLLVDDMPIDRALLRDIRRLLATRELYPGDERDLREGAQALSLFVFEAQRRLLPMIRERLGISGLAPTRRVADSTQMLLRRLVASAFPDNLEHLRILSERLEASLR